MATGGELALTPAKIAELAAAISSRNMETIAVRYLDVDMESIESMRDYYREPESLNREITRMWSYKNSSPDQVKVRSTHTLI